jgi:hypothetical protein
MILWDDSDPEAHSGQNDDLLAASFHQDDVPLQRLALVLFGAADGQDSSFVIVVADGDGCRWQTFGDLATLYLIFLCLLRVSKKQR